MRKTEMEFRKFTKAGSSCFSLVLSDVNRVSKNAEGPEACSIYFVKAAYLL